MITEPSGLILTYAPRRGHSTACALALAAVMTAAGCRAPGEPTAPQYDRGLVWVFPGIEGGASSVADAVRAFRDAGVESAVEIHDWQRPFGLIVNLVSYERNRADAGRIAQRLAEYRSQHPAAPIDLVGYSGGGGLAVMVAEALPDEVRLRNVVLSQPALSDDYDLSRVLRYVDGQTTHFHSELDWVILGAGTTLMGTMDRRHGASAGWRGFDIDRVVPDETLRHKLAQHEWSPEMIRDGHLGGHGCMFSYKRTSVGWRRISSSARQPTQPGDAFQFSIEPAFAVPAPTAASESASDSGSTVTGHPSGRPYPPTVITVCPADRPEVIWV